LNIKTGNHDLSERNNRLPRLPDKESAKRKRRIPARLERLSVQAPGKPEWKTETRKDVVWKPVLSSIYLALIAEENKKGNLIFNKQINRQHVGNSSWKILQDKRLRTHPNGRLCDIRRHAVGIDIYGRGRPVQYGRSRIQHGNKGFGLLYGTNFRNEDINAHAVELSGEYFGASTSGSRTISLSTWIKTNTQSVLTGIAASDIKRKYEGYGHPVYGLAEESYIRGGRKGKILEYFPV
jgi:hypothetical protein